MFSEMVNSYLWCVSLDWGTAFGTTVQSKMNERLRIRKSHLVENQKCNRMFSHNKTTTTEEILNQT